MARPLRIEYKGAWYHVMSRGNQKQPIFYNDLDRKKFLKILGESSRTFEVEIHGYVLMENHFHFLLTTPRGNLSRFMHQFNSAYTIHFNRIHQLVGHLFQGRFRSPLTEAERYLYKLSRYIHLNPVRKKRNKNLPLPEKIKILEEYGWSSYPAYIGRRPPPSFLFMDKILDLDDTSKGFRKEAAEYRRFIISGLKEGVRDPMEESKAGNILGSDEFIKSIGKYIDEKRGVRGYTRMREIVPEITLDEIAAKVAEKFNADKDKIKKRRGRPAAGRRILLELCSRYLRKDMSLVELGNELGGISPSAFLMNRQRLLEDFQENNDLKKKFEKIRRELLSD